MFFSSGSIRLSKLELDEEELRQAYAVIEQYLKDLDIEAFEAEDVRRKELIEQGELVCINTRFWTLGADSIWTKAFHSDEVEVIKFTELKGEDIILVFNALERKRKNKGIMGVFRRFGRKVT